MHIDEGADKLTIPAMFPLRFEMERASIPEEKVGPVVSLTLDAKKRAARASSSSANGTSGGGGKVITWTGADGKDYTTAEVGDKHATDKTKALSQYKGGKLAYIIGKHGEGDNWKSDYFSNGPFIRKADAAETPSAETPSPENENTDAGESTE